MGIEKGPQNYGEGEKKERISTPEELEIDVRNTNIEVLEKDGELYEWARETATEDFKNFWKELVKEEVKKDRIKDFNKKQLFAYFNYEMAGLAPGRPHGTEYGAVKDLLIKHFQEEEGVDHFPADKIDELIDGAIKEALDELDIPEKEPVREAPELDEQSKRIIQSTIESLGTEGSAEPLTAEDVLKDYEQKPVSKEEKERQEALSDIRLRMRVLQEGNILPNFDTFKEKDLELVQEVYETQINWFAHRVTELYEEVDKLGELADKEKASRIFLYQRIEKEKLEELESTLDILRAQYAALQLEIELKENE